MNPKDPQTEAEVELLVVTAQKGDSDAFGKIYDVFVDQIYRYIFFRVGERDAEDLTEIVFLKVWENIKQYKRNYTGSNNGASNFSSWIFRIAHNLVVDHYRSQRAQDELTESIQDFSNESNAVFRAHRRLDREALSGAMKQLKDHYKQFIVLKYINGFSNQEIAEITGKSSAALRIMQFRALKTLKNILERMGITENDV